MTGASAFAETRHRDETEAPARNDENRADRNNRQNSNFNDRNGNRQGNSTYDNRNGNRQGNSTYDNRNGNRQGNSTYDNRNGNRQGNSAYDNRGDRNNNSMYRGESRRNESFQGRVNRVERGRSGYNVWVSSSRYPFFIGFDRWSRFPIRVGVDVRLGGYWNPAGYYDVYDVGSYATAGSLHGVVENIDYRRGTLVMRDDVSGSFVTVVMRGNDPRFGSLRQGDLIDLTGAWNRSGVFEAYNVADVRGGYDPRYDGRGGY